MILYHGNDNIKLNWNKVFSEIWLFFSLKLISLFHKLMEKNFNCMNRVNQSWPVSTVEIKLLNLPVPVLGNGNENIKFNSQILRREVCSRLFVLKKFLGNRELFRALSVCLSSVHLLVCLSVCLFSYYTYLTIWSPITWYINLPLKKLYLLWL